MLSILPLSVIIPLIDVGFSSHHVFQNTSIPMLFDDFGGIENNSTQTAANDISAWSFHKIIVLIYTFGVLTYLVRMVINIFNLIRTKHQSESYVIGRFRFIFSDVPMVFSCFRWIFLPLNNKQKMHTAIVEHEKLHGKAWHTLDLGLIELFIALFWFNPFVYLFLRDLKAVHEYQVDSMILQRNFKKSDYLQLMLNNLVSSHNLVSICNYFNGLTLNKRIKMITKEKSPKWKLFRYILIVPIVVIMTMSFSASVNKGGDIPSISPIKVGDYEKVYLEFGETNPNKRIHKGIDFKANIGTEIVATADGVVTTVEFHDKGYGNRVIIDHGDSYVTLYAHMKNFTVKTGDKVKRGDVIGMVGSTGYSTASHLHYEVHKGGKPVNPQNYIKD
jgi:beta-lactamase regulating signal transducer with metallopeptidase domain